MIGLFCVALAALAAPFKSKLRLEAENADGEKMAAVCRDFNVSRKTGYKILKRVVSASVGRPRPFICAE